MSASYDTFLAPAVAFLTPELQKDGMIPFPQTPQTPPEEEHIALGWIHSNACSPKLGIPWWVQGESDWGPVGGEAGGSFKAFQTAEKLQYLTLNFTTLHYTTLHYAKLHYTTLHYTIINKLHFTTLH